jgi:hypothetical protein
VASARLLLFLVMPKLTFIALLLYLSPPLHAQQDMFLFKKKHTTITLFSKGSYIAFQMAGGEWHTGFITRIKADSFYIQPRVVVYHLISTDTLHFNTEAFTFADVYAMPRRGLQIDFIDGRFQINRAAGHMHFYWVKSGWIFRAGSLGYIVLDAINGLLRNRFTFTGGKYGIAAGVFTFGEILRRSYKVVFRMGKKYHLESLPVDTKK